MNQLPDELPNLSSLSHEQKDEIIRMLFPLIAEVRRLSARVAELEARLSKDSHNSSKPPSSDGLAKKSSSPSIPSGKKPGGQRGHAGKTLERSARVDTFIADDEAIFDVASGRVDLVFASPPSSIPLIKAGKLRGLSSKVNVWTVQFS